MQELPFFHNSNGICYVLDKPYPDGKAIGIAKPEAVFKNQLRAVCLAIVSEKWKPAFEKQAEFFNKRHNVRPSIWERIKNWFRHG